MRTKTEFRIFKAGDNVTEIGTFVFDEAAAKSVMDLNGNRAIMITGATHHLDELLGVGGARGWCRLEVRGGELWAVMVTLTAAGHAELGGDRFISPAFVTNEHGSRVLRVVSLAFLDVSEDPCE